MNDLETRAAREHWIRLSQQTNEMSSFDRHGNGILTIWRKFREPVQDTILDIREVAGDAWS